MDDCAVIILCKVIICRWRVHPKIFESVLTPVALVNDETYAALTPQIIIFLPYEEKNHALLNMCSKNVKTREKTKDLFLFSHPSIWRKSYYRNGQFIYAINLVLNVIQTLNNFKNVLWFMVTSYTILLSIVNITR